MSDADTPNINVTRGKKKSRKRNSSGRSGTGGVLPGPMEVASGLVRGTRTLRWAGLGVWSVAEEAGTKVFDALVEEGKSWEQAQRERTEQTVRRVEELSQEGTRAIENVEEQVRDDVHDALHRLGVPHRDDVDELRNQIDALSKKLDRLADAIREDA